MSWTYAQIKSILTGMSPQTFSGSFINQNSGSPTELALYARFTNMEIAANPHKFKWALRSYTLTFTGATSYDLGTLIPDLVQVYQVVGESLPSRQATVLPLNEFNIITGGTVLTFQGKTLKVKNPPTAGSTVEIPYFSNYLVATSGGTRQMDFTADTDVSIIPDEHAPMLIEGIMRFVYRKENTGKGKSNQYVRTVMTWDGRLADLDPFMHLMTQAVLSDNDLAKDVYDFRIQTV